MLEYLEQQGNLRIRDYNILESCLKCLSAPELDKLSFAPKTRLFAIASAHLQIIRTLPFVLYVTEYWPSHVRGDCRDVQRLLVYLANTEKLDLWNPILDFHMSNCHGQLLRSYVDRCVSEQLASVLCCRWGGSDSYRSCSKDMSSPNQN